MNFEAALGISDEDFLGGVLHAICLWHVTFVASPPVLIRLFGGASDPDVLDQLALHPVPNCRVRAARNGHASEQTLRRLSIDPDETIRAEAERALVRK